MSQRVDARQLAKIWIVTPQRVNQLARQGRIVKGADGKFDLAEAMAFRRQQISEQEVQTLLKTYGSRHGTVTDMKVGEHLRAAEQDGGGVRPPEVQFPPDVRDCVEHMLFQHAGQVMALPDLVAKSLGVDALDEHLREAISFEATGILLKLHAMAFFAGCYR